MPLFAGRTFCRANHTLPVHANVIVISGPAPQREAVPNSVAPVNPEAGWDVD